MPRRRILALAFLLCLAGCERGTAASNGSPSRPPRTLFIATDRGRVELRAELAISDAEKEMGLKGRTHLPPNSAMAFLFDAPTTSRFWMKDTLIPLSIAFWDEQRRIIGILDMVPCTQDPCPTYGPGPDVAYRGAVEANAGFFAEHAVRVGDTVGWEVPRE